MGQALDLISAALKTYREEGVSAVQKKTLLFLRERKGIRDTATKKNHDDILQNKTPEKQMPLCSFCEGKEVIERKEFKLDSYQMFHCIMCGTGFINPLPTPEELKSYYSKDYWGNGRGEEIATSSPIHGDTSFIADLIQKYNPSANKIFEVGCGVGTLLHGLKTKGFDVYGQDYSDEASAIAKNFFNLDISAGPIAHFSFPKTDCIIMRHVLEHSPTPLSDFGIVSNALEKGKILIIAVPNYNSFVAKCFGPHWEWFVPPTHLFYFSLMSFQHLALRYGMNIVWWTTRRGDAMLLEDLYKANPQMETAPYILENRETIDRYGKLYKENPSLLYEAGFGEELVVVMKK